MNFIIYIFAVIGLVVTLYVLIVAVWGVLLTNDMTEDEIKEFFAEQDEESL